ncbi:MAG: hypothetical protein IKR19_08820 [Acholeplasmatales bacterium]|nr:hypothetical protein [Acholeplasmatales bacterium]
MSETNQAKIAKTYTTTMNIIETIDNKVDTNIFDEFKENTEADIKSNSNSIIENKTAITNLLTKCTILESDVIRLENSNTVLIIFDVLLVLYIILSRIL